MKKKKIIKIVSLVLLILLLLNLVVPYTVYEIVFANSKSIDPNTNFHYQYDIYQDEYPREEITYSVGDYNLCGYSYLKNETDYLVVTVHGFRDFSDYLLDEDILFLNNGYNVFSFDASGCGKSEGSMNGFSQTLIDLEKTLDFLNTDTRYKDYKKLLFGFSEGGYSVTSVLSLNVDNVYGVAAVSAYNDAKHLVLEKGFEYAGPFVYLGWPLIVMKEAIVFKDYLDIKAEDAINSSTTPVFLAHGTNDSTVTYKLSALSKFEDSNRVVKHLEEAGHGSLLYSKRAREYQHEVKEKNIENVDRTLYNELNGELFSQILDFFASC